GAARGHRLQPLQPGPRRGAARPVPAPAPAAAAAPVRLQEHVRPSAAGPDGPTRAARPGVLAPRGHRPLPLRPDAAGDGRPAHRPADARRGGRSRGGDGAGAADGRGGGVPDGRRPRRARRGAGAVGCVEPPRGGGAGVRLNVARSRTMESKNDRKPNEPPTPDEPPAPPKKRFRIEKLEERITPKK